MKQRLTDFLVYALILTVWMGVDFYRRNAVVEADKAELVMKLEEANEQISVYEEYQEQLRYGGLELPVGAPTLVPIRISRWATVTSPFGVRVSVFRAESLGVHQGVDVAGIYRGEVLSGGGGRVLHHWLPPETERNGRVYEGHDVYGGYIVIDHGNGFTSHYAHLSETYVYEGMEVAEGHVIGRMGDTGMADGIHLHYEVREEDVSVDPVEFWVGVEVLDDGRIVVLEEVG